MRYLETFALLSLLVLIHELGHLWAAKWIGIPVAGFSVGFGPKLWSWRRGGTEYALRVLPLGGYVLPATESYEEFQEIPLRRRLAFYLGGPLANVAAAVPLFALWNALLHGPTLRGLFVAPFAQTIRELAQTLAALPAGLGHFQQLRGVVGIVQLGGGLSAQADFVWMAIQLTISLALINLLPIPVLDGGKILLALLEKALPRSRRLQIPVTLASVVLLVALTVFLGFLDLFRLVA